MEVGSWQEEKGTRLTDVIKKRALSLCESEVHSNFSLSHHCDDQQNNFGVTDTQRKRDREREREKQTE